MRFVIAIAAFVVAAVMIGVGIAQRTIWAPPASLTASAEVKSAVPYIVVNGSTLNANSGQQTLRIAGDASPFVAYGRTADVMAWIGDEPYARLSYDPASQSLKSTLVRAGGAGTDSTSKPTPSDTPSSSDQATPPVDTASPTPTPTAAPSGTPSASPSAGAAAGASAPALSLDPKAPSPDGSDLWLEQFSGSSARTTRMNVPRDVSVIIAADGAHAAPGQVSLTWPMDTRTPWAGPLIVLGGALFAAGAVFYVLAIRHVRRGRGPRRGGGGGRPPRLTRQPRAPRVREIGGARTDSHGRRSIGRGLIAVPAVLLGVVTLAGCSSDYWPAIGQSPTPTMSSTPLATQLPGSGADHPAPAVTEPQLRNIVARIAGVAKNADAARDAGLAATRFTGPALTERQVNYQIRSAKPGYAAPQAIPTTAKLYPILPQATDAWPRVVDVVVADPANKTVAPLNLVLTQASPRDNYKVDYAVVMLAGARIPDLAPATIGAAVVPPDSKLLTVPPRQLGQYYADVLALGKASKDYKYFDEDADALTKAAGADSKAQAIATFQTNNPAGTEVIGDKPGQGDPIAIATNDAGALVTTSVQETLTAKPNDPAASVNVTSPDGPTAALTGVTTSSKGFETTYVYQLLFYVPPAESGEKIRLLGFTQGATGARELP